MPAPTSTRLANGNCRDPAQSRGQGHLRFDLEKAILTLSENDVGFCSQRANYPEMITLDVERIHLPLAVRVRGLATGAHVRAALAPRFCDTALRNATTNRRKLTISETTLQRMIVKYSEQLVFQPLKEARYWFTYQSGAFLEPGYPPLYYSRDNHKKLSANKSACAAIGEGVAGYLAQRLYRAHKLARPNHDYPDIVMEAGGLTYLVEAKATFQVKNDEIRATLRDELPRFVALCSSAEQLDVRPVRGLLIGTVLDSEVDYRTILMEVELV